MRNKYYIGILSNICDSLIEEEKGYNEDIRIIQQMFEDIIYHKKIGTYSVDRLKEKIKDWEK